MGTLGSASIKLNLDRSQFDSDLKKLQATDAGQIAYRIKLDTKDFERQIKGLRIQQPIFIPLQVDTKTFDQQIKKLSTSIDPIKIDLAPNVKDFQEKLRRLSNISTITVDIKVDEGKVKQQFETIGKYAAEGFTQGFSGVEGAGKSAIDSMVKSVNRQLGIQSPSKVFREIGKFAIAGLMQGLDSVDTRAIVNKITSEFKAIDISTEVRLIADTKGLQRQITGGLVASVNVEVSGNSTSKLSDSIADAVAHAVKKTQSKGLFGGILDMVAAPFKLASGALLSVVTLPFKALGAGLGHTFEGLFLGAGLPLGESLGAGIAKGVNTALKGKFKANLSQIGINLTDLSKADWNLAKAIDALFIEGNPIGKAKKAVKDLQDVFGDLKLLVAPGTIEKVVDFGKLSSGSPRDFRKKYLAAAKAAKEQGRELTPEQFTEELKPKAEFKAVGTAIKLAAAPLGFKNKVMSFEAQRQIEARSQKLIIPDISEPSVTLAVGGFQKERGRGSHAIAKSAKNVLPNSHVIAIPNTYTDRKATDTHSELLNFIKSLGGDVPPGLLDTIQNTEKLVGTAAHGYSPDAIRIAAYARAVQRKYPDKPVNAVTFSGGTYPLEQAIQFDTDAGGKAKGIGLGAGLYGLTGRHNPNYRAMIGEQDPLGFPFQLLPPTKNTTIIPNFADTTSMDVHNPKRYFANPSVQGAMSEMFTGFVPPQGNVKAQESIFELTNRKVATDKHINRLNRFIADPATVPSHKVDESFGELADFLAKQGADFKTIPTIPPQEIPSDPKLRTLPKLMASGDSLALDAQHYYSQVQNTYKKTSAVLAKPLNIPEAQLETYEPEQRVKVIRAVSKVKSEAPGLARTIDRIGGAPEDEEYSFFTRNAALAPKRAQDLKGLISYLRGQVFTDLPKDIDKLAQEYLKYLEELHAALAKFVETGEAIAPEILAQKDKLNLLSFDPIEASTKTQPSTTEAFASSPPVGQEIPKSNLPSAALDLAPKPQPLIESGINPTLQSESNAKKIEEGFKKYSETFKNQVQASQEIGDFTEVNKQIQDFIKYAARAKKELEEIRQSLISIGKIEKSDSQNSASIAKKTITNQTKKIQQELGKSGNSVDLVSAIDKELGLTKKTGAEARQKLQPLQPIEQPLSKGQELEVVAQEPPIQQKKLPGIFDIGLSKPGKNKANEKIKSGQEELKLATENFQKIFASVIKSAGLKPEEVEGRIPTVSFLSAIAKGGGQYTGKGNRIALPLDARRRLALGKLSMDDLITIAHEVRHAIQLDFGRAQEADVASGKVGIPLLSTKRKSDKKSAEASTRAYRQQYKENRGYLPSDEELRAVMALEEDAVAFAAELAPAIHKNLKNILKPRKDGKPLSIPTSTRKIPLPPAPWEVDPSLDFRNVLKPKTTLFSIPLSTTPPPPPGFNSPIGKLSFVPPPPPGFNLPITKTTLPPPPPGFNQPIGKPTQTPPPPPGFYSPGVIPKLTPPDVPGLGSAGNNSTPVNDGKDPNRGITAFFSGLKVGKQGRDTAAGAIGNIFKNIKNQAEESFPILKNFSGLLSSLFKGFLAFQGGMILQSVLSKLSVDAFKAYVELDRLKTALNFASGGSAGGAQNLAFVRKTVEDLRVPLKASAEGFVQLAAAAKGSALEGKGTREIFTGISQASTVLSLSADQTQGAILALSQMISKGKVSAEELRCYDYNTEVLISRGWVRWDEVSDRDLFASQNLETGEIEFQSPSRTIRYRYTGLMLRVNSENIDLLVTPDHRMVVRDANETEFKIVKAKDLEPKPYFYSADFDSRAEVLVDPSSLEWVEFDDEVFCVEVPFTTLYVRRSGKTCWSGNSQLAERLPGAMGIAARSMGVTEAEFQRLLDTGQVLSQDFLPKFAKQLQSEFGDAAKDASGNAQSGIFGVENAFLSLQQSIGEGVAPAAIAGLNAFGEILKGVATVGKEIAIIIAAVSAALLVNLGKALWTIIGQLILTKAAGATLGGAFSQLASTINNSFSAQITVGIFALLEAINLVNSAVNTELVQSFNKAGEAAKRAAEESRKRFGDPGKEPEKDTGKPGEPSIKPVSSSWFGRFYDDHIAPVYNADIGPFRGGDVFSGNKETFGSYEQGQMQAGVGDLVGEAGNLAIDTRKAIKQLQTRTGDIGKLPAVNTELTQAEQQRQIIQAQTKRDYTDKGLAIPAQAKQDLDNQNIKIQQLNDKRAEIAKPYNLQIADLDRQINTIKAKREEIKSPDAITTAGGTEAAARMDEQLKSSYELLKGLKAQAESALGALRINPIQAFTNALRGLNLALAEGQEKNKESLAKNKLANAREAIAGFSTDKLASKKLTFKNADDEYKAAQIDEANSAKAVKTYDEAASKPDFQSTLKRLGLTPDSSAAKIDDILKNTSDESDKNILEQLKAGRESKVKFTEAQSATVDTKAKRDQVIQDTSLYLLDDSAANSRSKIQKDENDKISFLKGAQAAKLISEEAANEQIARIQLNSSQSQKKSIVDQLTTLRAYHEQGKVSAEEFTKRQRDLSTELTATERQEAENRLAVQQAVIARRLKDIEFVNKKAESAIALSSTNETTKAKEKLLGSGLTPQATDQFALDKNSIDQKAAADNVALVKTKIAQNQQEYKAGRRSAREFAELQMALNQELAQNNQQLIDLKITAEEKYREIFEHNIQRIMQAEENRFKKQTSQLDESKAKLDLYNQSLERTSRLEQSRNNLSKALSNAALAPLENQKADADDDLTLAEKLKDPKISRREKAAIKAKLREHGYGPTTGVTVTPATVTKSTGGDNAEDYELQIKQKKEDTEQNIARIKELSMKAEQEFQRKALENDLKRQKIAAQTALYEAQSAQYAAQKSKNEAEGALKIAISKKDPLAIETAQTNLNIANKQIDLSNQRVDSAQANLNDQPEIAANATQEQKVTQGTEAQNLLAGESRRRRGAAIDLVETSEKAGKPISLPEAEKDRTPGLALPTRIDINQMPKLELKPGENIFDAYQRQRDGMKLPTQGATLPSSKADMPPMDTTALALKSTSIQPRESSGGNQFVEALKMANQGIEQRLDALNSAIMTLANTPRSLSISSPNPIDDAADFMNRIGRGQVVAAGA